MVKSKDKSRRVKIILECTSCSIRNNINFNKRSTTGIYRYSTKKNRYNTPNLLALKKFCPYCYKHTIYKEKN